MLKSTLTIWDTVAPKWSEKIVPEICGWDQAKSLFQFYVDDISKTKDEGFSDVSRLGAH